MGEIVIPAFVTTLVLVVVRVVLVVAFVLEAKIKLDDIKKFAKADGLPLPLAWAVAIAETAAAVSFLTGVLAQWAALGVMLLMIATVCFHLFKWRSPYPAGKGGWEYDVLLFTLAAVVFAFGPSAIVLPM